MNGQKGNECGGGGGWMLMVKVFTFLPFIQRNEPRICLIGFNSKTHRDGGTRTLYFIIAVPGSDPEVHFARRIIIIINPDLPSVHHPANKSRLIDSCLSVVLSPSIKSAAHHNHRPTIFIRVLLNPSTEEFAFTFCLVPGACTVRIGQQMEHTYLYLPWSHL